MEGGGIMVEVFLYDHQDGFSLDLARLEALLREAVALIWDEVGAVGSVLRGLEEVEVSLVDDGTIARVHGEFLEDATPTDVITFDHGEVLVSVTTAARRAPEFGHTLEEECLLYMIHGVLHLHGYNDHEVGEREVMHARQEEVLRAVWRVG